MSRPTVTTRDAADLLVSESRVAPSAVRAYLTGAHCNVSTRAILEAARIKLGLAPVPRHAPCAQCVNARHAAGRFRRIETYHSGGWR